VSLCVRWRGVGKKGGDSEKPNDRPGMNANFEQLLTALRNIADFAQRAGAKKQAVAFEKLHGRLKADKRSSKSLEEDVFTARGLAAFWIASHISKQTWDAARKEQMNAEFSRLRQSLDEALTPPKPGAFPETEIQGLAGNLEHTSVWGDPKEARIIAQRAIDVVQRFSSAIFHRDIENAYGLCANELRNGMSVKRFITALDKADKNYGGRAVQCRIERVTHIEADELSREKSGNRRANWPKDTPKSNKRATVGTFWFTDPAANKGRWVSFWITEEAGGYRIAKFNQYLQ
jgi:hypothetical protein